MGLATQMMKEVAALIRLGFPESTATKIASGELPMDTASRMERAAEQGYDVDTPVYHGSMQDIRGEYKPQFSDGLMFTTHNPEFASSWAGKGSMQTRDGELDAFDRYRPQKQAMYDELGQPEYGTPEYEEFDAKTRAIYLQEQNAFKTVYPLTIKSKKSFDPTAQNAYEEVSEPIFKDLYETDRLDAQTEKYLRDGAYLHYENPQVVEALKERGYDSMKLRESTSGELDTLAMFDGSKNVRSISSAAFDPDYKGSNILGEYALPAGSTALMASLLAAPEEAEAGFVTRGGRELLEAWHGSPHEFDRFSMDAIGTGEGAQAYGHGLYMADAQDVAKGYRDSLTPRDYEFEEAAYNRYKQLEEMEDYEGMEVFELAMSHESPADMRHRFSLDERSPEATERINRYIDEVESMPTNRGHLYRTEIDVTPDQLLDWDKPLSEQPRAIQNIATESTPEFQGFIDELAGINPEAAELAEKMMYGPESVRAGTEEAYQNWERLGALVGDSDIDLNRLHDVTDAAYGRRDKWGATFYDELASSPAEASSLLSDRGIKGIKYLDGDSRGKFIGRTMRDGRPYSDDVRFPDERSRNEWKAEKEAEGFDVELDDGTSNYVIFDDKLINIAERGAATPGMMALLGAGGAGATAAGSESNAVTEATSRIVNHMLDNVTEVTDLLEIPQRGIQGLLRAGYGLMKGDGLDASLNAGADVVNQGVEETARQAGDAMLEKTGNPELATMAYTAVMLGSPL